MGPIGKNKYLCWMPYWIEERIRWLYIICWWWPPGSWSHDQWALGRPSVLCFPTDRSLGQSCVFPIKEKQETNKRITQRCFWVHHWERSFWKSFFSFSSAVATCNGSSNRDKWKLVKSRGQDLNRPHIYTGLLGFGLGFWLWCCTRLPHQKARIGCIKSSLCWGDGVAQALPGSFVGGHLASSSDAGSGGLGAFTSKWKTSNELFHVC